MSNEAPNIHEKPKRRRGIAEYMPFLPALAAVALRILHWTCRIELVGEENYRAAKDFEGPGIAAFWHFSYPAILYFFRDRGYLTIISRSRDGELAARAVGKLGYFPFRGSPGKGGVAALKGIIAAFKRGPGGGFVADGSQGPARVAQKGLLLLALHSGSPILPVSVAADRCWRLRTWDGTMIPKPFSRLVFSFAPMIRVERGVSAEKLEEYRVLLEQSLEDATDLAERVAGAFAYKAQSATMK